MTELSIYRKLANARVEFLSKDIKKSGQNAFAKYKYFELDDLMPPIQKIMADVGLCGVVSFDRELATLTIYDCDSKDTIVITSPMVSAEMKGCLEIQKMGSVETYQRRYLWLAAFEIVEHDAINATDPKENDEKIKHSPVPNIEIDPARMNVLEECVIGIAGLINADDIFGGYEIYEQITDGDEKTWIWKKLGSNVRAAIKKHGLEIKEKNNGIS